MAQLQDFVGVRGRELLREAIMQFHGDPPDTDHQAGYLAGMTEAYRMLFGSADGVVADVERIKQLEASDEAG